MPNATGGMLAGLMAGYDEQNKIDEHSRAVAEAKRRQDIIDAQNAQLFTQKAAGNQQALDMGKLNLDSAPAALRRQATLGDLNITGQKQKNAAGQFALDYQQQVFDQGEALNNARIGSENAQTGASNARTKATTFSLGQAQDAASRTKTQDAMSGAVAGFLASGDATDMVNQYNAANPHNPVTGFKAMQDGSYQLTFQRGTKRSFKNANELARTAEIAVHPRVIAMDTNGLGKGGFPQKTATQALVAYIGRTHGLNLGDPEQARQAFTLAQQISFDPAETRKAAVGIAMQNDPMFTYGTPVEQQAKVAKIVSLLQQGSQVGVATQQPATPVQSSTVAGLNAAMSSPEGVPKGHGAIVMQAIDKTGKYGPRGGLVVRYADGTVGAAP